MNTHMVRVIKKMYTKRIIFFLSPACVHNAWGCSLRFRVCLVLLNAHLLLRSIADPKMALHIVCFSFFLHLTAIFSWWKSHILFVLCACGYFFLNMRIIKCLLIVLSKENEFLWIWFVGRTQKENIMQNDIWLQPLKNSSGVTSCWNACVLYFYVLHMFLIMLQRMMMGYCSGNVNGSTWHHHKGRFINDVYAKGWMDGSL